MAAKQKLDMEAMQEGFFTDSSLIGIACALPGHGFAFLLNKCFGLSFTREPDNDVCLQTGPENILYFPVYHCEQSFTGAKHLLYKLKTGDGLLLPELKSLDYLWLVQSNDTKNDTEQIINLLRKIPEIQLAQPISADQLKNLNSLLV